MGHPEEISNLSGFIRFAATHYKKVAARSCRNPECCGEISNQKVFAVYSRITLYYCNNRCYQRHLEIVRIGAKERVRKFMEKQKEKSQ
jgi:hypothetical protein